MFDHKHYVPILKGKRAEFPAIGDLKSRQGMTPLFQSVPTNEPSFVPRNMSAVWDAGVPFLVDLLWLDDDDLDEGAAAQHPLPPQLSIKGGMKLRSLMSRT